MDDLRKLALVARRHALVLGTALTALAAVAVLILVLPSPVNAFTAILGTMLFLLSVGLVLYCGFADEWMTNRKAQLSSLGRRSTSADVLEKWVAEHRAMVAVSAIVLCLLLAIAGLAANGMISPIKWLAMWVAVLIVVTTIHRSIVGARRRRRLVISGFRVRGTIVDRREVHRQISGPDGDDTYDAYWVTYSFDPIDQVNLRQESRVSEAEWDSLPVGTEVEVAFEAADPTYNLMVFGDNK